MNAILEWTCPKCSLSLLLNCPTYRAHLYYFSVKSKLFILRIAPSDLNKLLITATTGARRIRVILIAPFTIIISFGALTRPR
jgi:hypothetical protein